MLRALLPALVLAAFLLPARALAQAGDRRYQSLDATDSAYSFQGDSLALRFPHWNGYGTSTGARMRLESLILKGGGLRFCLDASHSYGDYGWEDFDECGGAIEVPGILAQFRKPDSLRPNWVGGPGNDLLFLTVGGDSLRFQRMDRGDTLVLSWWWLQVKGKADLVVAGHYDLETVRTLTRFLVREARLGSMHFYEGISILRVVQRFVPEGTVTVLPGRASGRQAAAPRVDVLGRLPSRPGSRARIPVLLPGR